MWDPDIRPIFIFSIPRSGSTLSQRILATHEEIETVSEPFILLPYLYSLREDGVYSAYNHEHAAWAIQDFCQELPGGVEDYLAEIRTLALRLYAKVAGKEARYFVDKTPNYYLIVDDIIRLFPEGKFIFLWRNPLAVAASLMASWHGGRWSLYQFDIHIFEGLAKLVAAYQKYGDSIPAIRYKDLLDNPVAEWERIFAYLELPFDPEAIAQFSHVQLKGRLADPGVKRYQALSKEPLEKWKSVLANPLRKAWCRRYLRWIGRERLAVMGYELDKLLAELASIPFSPRFLASDMWWMPYGTAYRLLEGRIMKDKLRGLLLGRRAHLHK